MPHNTEGLLSDMLDAAEFILSDTSGVTLDEFLQDRRLRQSVERSFEVIGEAARRLAITDAGTAARIDDISQMIAFRNVIAHGYDQVKPERVWEIVNESVPALRRQIVSLLDE